MLLLESYLYLAIISGNWFSFLFPYKKRTNIPVNSTIGLCSGTKKTFPFKAFNL